MERERDGDDCHTVGPRSLCGLWFQCATKWQLRPNAQKDVSSGARSSQEECGCKRSLILEQNGNVDETNTKVQQFQHVKSRECTMFIELTTRATHIVFLVCNGGPLLE